MEMFSGGGELGALLRQKDWSSTPLGPISAWPQSLKTSVSLILSSQHPMWIGWGKEMTFLYNDAYIPVLSLAKHPWALGRPAQEVWSEIWDVCGPLADLVFREAKPTFLEDVRLFMSRGDYVEETYYSFSYSPIHDESGGVGGLFCPSAETTARVLNTRRLRTLSELATNALVERSIEGACASAIRTLAKNPDDVPFALLYMADPSSGEPRLVQRVGFASSERIAWPVAQAIASSSTTRFSLDAAVNIPTGIANQPVADSVLLPLRPRGGDSALGVLVVAVNPGRKLDDEYRTFFELVAQQITTAIQNARAAEEEKQRADKLAELDRAKTTFFSNVSHEFRTPLTLLIGPTEDALASPDRALRGPALESVYRNELRLMKLVNSLLDFSRIEAGRAQARFEQVDLSQLTRELASIFQSAIESAGLGFVLQCEPLPEPVYVDRDMWEKIVLNLLSNALKFTFRGEIAVTLRAVDHDGSPRAELRVRDTGGGISAAELPRLFERFHRIEGAKARTHEGSGIGLALVQELVHMHGGTIAVDSALGAGTTFAVSIPFGSKHLPAEHVLEKPSLPSGDAPLSIRSRAQKLAFVAETSRWFDGNAAGSFLPGIDAPLPSSAKELPAHLLVVDDNADMRDYVARLLSAHWTVETVADGEAALARLREKPFDIVLTDIMMPNLDGFGLLKAIREDEALKHVCVIMLSARAGDEASVDGLKAGADDYLVKPFSARELVARIRTRLEIARTRREAEEARARLHRQLMQAPVPMSVVVGPEFRFELANPEYVEMVGHRDLVGKTFRQAFPELPDDAPVLTMLREVYETGVPYRATEYQVAIRNTQTGALEDKYYHFACHPFLGLDNEIEGLMTAAIDVTEQVNARREIESARHDAELANRSKDEFLAMLGHELRNPLSPIVTALQLLQLKGRNDRELQVISRQVQHVGRLVDDLLDVSRITRGKVELRKERIEIARVVIRAIEMTAPLLEQRRQTVDVDVPPEGLPIDGDPDRLAQIVSNLLTNASKYSEPGTRVHVAAERAGDFARLHVRDEGIGIDQAMIPRVFDLFVQQPQALDRAKGGLGLGLAIVKSLVELHGGTARVESQGVNGKGSEFIVDLPIHGDDLSKAPREEERRPPKATPITTSEKRHPAPLAPSTPPHVVANAKMEQAPSKGRVLIVDDNVDSAEMIEVLLSHLGYEVKSVANPLTALAIVDEFQPTACLLDIGLPDMNGYELAQRLRQGDSSARFAKLIAITGYSQESDRKRSVEAGFDAHVVKPVSLDILTKVLADVA